MIRRQVRPAMSTRASQEYGPRESWRGGGLPQCGDRVCAFRPIQQGPPRLSAALCPERPAYPRCSGTERIPGIRALDPNVTQEVLKLNIAHKAQTNFVDIVLQAKRLRLSLNMPFTERDDPRDLAKDVTGIGRWGNGDVELGIATLEEVPYAIGLILLPTGSMTRPTFTSLVLWRPIGKTFEPQQRY